MATTDKNEITRRVYPETAFGGFTRFDGTVAFCTRVQALIGPDDVVLDIGCGRAKRIDDQCAYRRSLQNFQAPGRRVIGIDVDPAASANPFLDEFKLIETVARWPIEDASVNIGYCDYVLEHVEDPNAFFAEAWRVLKPGGYLCMRTPNARSYIAIISRLIPNRHHAKVTGYAQSSRKEHDVFPTVYRCNTRRTIQRQLCRHGFENHVYYHEAEPGYLNFSRLAYRCGAALHRVLPPMMRSTLLAFARKGD